MAIFAHCALIGFQIEYLAVGAESGDYNLWSLSFLEFCQRGLLGDLIGLGLYLETWEADILPSHLFTRNLTFGRVLVWTIFLLKGPFPVRFHVNGWVDCRLDQSGKARWKPGGGTLRSAQNRSVMYHPGISSFVNWTEFML